MVSREFLDRLRNYLDERFKVSQDPTFSFVIESDPNILRILEAKWFISSNLFEKVGVCENLDGRIEVFSSTLEDWKDWLDEMIFNKYYKRAVKRAEEKVVKEKGIDDLKAWDTEEVQRILKKERAERDSVLDDLRNRRWEKYLTDERLKKRYGKMFMLSLYWGDELAKRASERYGIKVEFVMGENGKTFFRSFIDPSGMNEDQIFNEIVIRADVLEPLLKEFLHNHEERKKFYKEFLEKRGLEYRKPRKKKPTS